MICDVSIHITYFNIIIIITCQEKKNNNNKCFSSLIFRHVIRFPVSSCQNFLIPCSALQIRIARYYEIIFYDVLIRRGADTRNAAVPLFEFRSVDFRIFVYRTVMNLQRR